MASALADYCEGARAAWRPPESFSLSDPDGVQAIVRKSSGDGWEVGPLEELVAVVKGGSGLTSEETRHEGA